MVDYQTIIVEKANHIATVTINRPDAMNSFTKRMLDEFGHLWRDLAEDDDTHVVVLRAAPGRAFSTGVDVKAAQEEGGVIMHNNVWVAADPGEKLSPKFNRCWKPVICAVHGMAAGGAFYWINESDIIICSEEASFFDPHVTYGMVAALEPIGATYRMPLGDVLRMTLLGNDERISATTALRIGLVTEVVPLDKLWDRANSWPRRSPQNPPPRSKARSVRESLELPRGLALQTSMKYTQVGNPIGIAQVDRWAIIGKAKKYETR